MILLWLVVYLTITLVTNFVLSYIRARYFSGVVEFRDEWGNRVDILNAIAYTSLAWVVSVPVIVLYCGVMVMFSAHKKVSEFVICKVLKSSDS